MATRREDILPTPVGVPSPAAPTVRATSAPAAPGAAPTSPAEPETPRAPSVSAPPSGVPQFADSPLQAIGVVLQDFAAGMRGQPLRSQQIEQAQMARRQLQIQEIDAGFKLLNQVRREVQSTNAGTPEREAKLEEMDRFVGAIIPTFRPLLERLEGIPGAGDVLETIPEFAEVFQAACGDDVECILEKSSDDNFIKPFQRRRDEENTPKIGQKLMLLNQGLASNPEFAELLPRDQFGNISANFSELEAANENFPPEIRLTDSELGTARRNPSILAAHGIVPPELALEELGGRLESERDVAEFAAKENIRTRETLAREAGKEAIKEPGRIADDARTAARQAAARASARNEKEAKAAEAIDGFVDLLDRRDQITKSAQTVTGIDSTLATAMESTVGQIASLFSAREDGTVLFPNIAEARENLRVFRQDMIRAFSNSKRFPVAEREDLKRLIPDPDNLIALAMRNPGEAVRTTQRFFEEVKSAIERNSDTPQESSADRISRFRKALLDGNDELASELAGAMSTEEFEEAIK